MTQTVKFDATWTTDRRRDTLVDMLRGHICEVTFVKVDGTVRVMPCTLDSRHIPPRVTESTTTKAPNPTTLSVWCTDKESWRSFKIDNVQEIKQIAPDFMRYI